ncbi:MAG: hypothetical protein ACI3VN_09095 [Candidatus Onthomonas sp.]
MKKMFPRLHRTGITAFCLMSVLLLLNLLLGGEMSNLLFMIWAVSLGLFFTVVLAGAVMNVSRRWQNGERWSILPGFLIAAGIALAALVALDWFGTGEIAWLADLGVGLVVGVIALDLKK